MEVNDPPKTHCQGEVECEGTDAVHTLLQWLERTGIEKSFADFIVNDVMAQIVIEQLLDKIEGLESELERSKRTNGMLTSRLETIVCKRPASPNENDSEGEDRRPRNVHEAE
jgi:hypothetical protein